MTTETATNPDAAPVLSSNGAEVLTAAQRRARIEAETQEAIRKATEKVMADQAKKLAKLDDEAEEAALREKRGELVAQEQEFFLGILQTLGIVIPEKGMTIKQEVKIEHGPNGSLMCSITIPEKKAASTSTEKGTRAPRGTGTGRHTITEIDGIESFTVGGAEVKSSSLVLKALDVDVKGDAPSRKIVSWALTEKEKANEVIVKFTDNRQEFLGDLVASHFGTVEAPATPVLPPPPLVTA